MLKPLLAAVLLLAIQDGAVQARDVTSSPDVISPPAASSGPPAATEPQGGAPPPDKGTITQTCTDSCNRSFDVCMDQQSAIPGNDESLRSSNNIANQLVGGTSDCKDHLRSCLNTCGG